jgi:aryl-alcohol dehydrogenase-like predicted oxidoreductase
MKIDSYHTLGRSGLRVSALAFGAMTFDDGSWGSAPSESFKILDRFYDAGGNFVDTANAYNEGRSEETLGAYFQQRKGRRDRMVVATKFGGTLYADDPNAGGAGRKAIRGQLEESLRRLQTDYVDLYWMHQWDRHTPVEETLSTLDDLVRAGKIRAIGVSNVPAWWIAQAATITKFRGWESIAALQIEYSLLAREAEGSLFAVVRAFGLGVTPWGPLASGLLSGKYSRTRRAVEGSGRAGHVAPRLTEPTFQVLDLLAQIADEQSTPIASVALAWVRQQPLVTSTLIGARTLDQLEANLASVEVELLPAQLAELDVLTKPAPEYPLAFADTTGLRYQQGNTTINGFASTVFRRPSA